MVRTYLRVAALALTLLSGWPVQAAAGSPPGDRKWASLSVQQREILAPLIKDWDGMEPFRRKKWLGIAERYPRMTADQQQRLQGQMETWARMTPAQREAARLRFKKLNEAPPAQREVLKEHVKEQWQQYNQLSPEEKEKLSHSAKKKTPPSGVSAPRPLTQPPVLVPRLSSSTSAQ